MVDLVNNIVIKVSNRSLDKEKKYKKKSCKSNKLDESLWIWILYAITRYTNIADEPLSTYTKKMCEKATGHDRMVEQSTGGDIGK